MSATALASCVLAVSAHYGVPRVRLEGVFDQRSTRPTLGATHIPSGWAPILSRYGFDLEKIKQDPCESVVAAGWILRFADDAQKAQKQIKKTVLPARAQQWQTAIQVYSRAAQIDPNLVNAVILQESRFHPHIVSDAGAYGLMQLTEDTAKMLGVNRYDPQQNLWGGIWYLSALHKAYQGNLALTLAAYNAGPGAVYKWKGIPPYRETLHYVPKVLARYEQIVQVAQTNTQPLAPPILARPDGQQRAQ